MKHFPRVIAVFATTVVLGHAQAQTPGAIDQVDSVQKRRALERPAEMTFKDGDSAPELYPGEASDVGPQSVLRIKPRRKWFDAQADVQYFWTDNMFLTRNNKQDADVLVSTAQFALAPTPFEYCDGTFAPRVGYRHQWYDFGLFGNKLDGTPLKLNAFDFNAQTLFADIRRTDEHWVLEAGFDYTRLMQTANYEDFYHEAVPRWAVYYVARPCEKSVFSIGYEGDYRFSRAEVSILGVNEHLNDRTDHGLVANYTFAVNKHAVVQPYYRFKYTHFTKVNQEDYLNSFGLAIYAIVCSNFDVRAFVGYELRRSSVGAAEYNKLDAGGGLMATIRF